MGIFHELQKVRVVPEGQTKMMEAFAGHIAVMEAQNNDALPLALNIITEMDYQADIVRFPEET